MSNLYTALMDYQFSIRIYICLLLTCILSSGQVLSQNTLNLDLSKENIIFWANSLSKDIELEGHPYIDDAFQLVKIDHYQEVFSGRYNAYNDQMEIKINSNDVIALDKNTDFRIVFNKLNKTYITSAYQTKSNEVKRGFFILVDTSATHSLLKKETIKFYNGEKALSSYQKDKPARFVRANDTYYLKTDDEASLIPKKKKLLFKLYPKHSKKIKKFLKVNKLSLKNEQDFIVLAEYISKL